MPVAEVKRLITKTTQNIEIRPIVNYYDSVGIGLNIRRHLRTRLQKLS